MRSKLNDNGVTKDDLIHITDKENQRYLLVWVGENAELTPVPEEENFPLRFEARENLLMSSDPPKAIFPLKFEVMCFTAVRAKDAEGRNALHYIACWGDPDVCRVLLAHEGFTAKDANAKDKRGLRPYPLALHMGHDDIAEQIKHFLDGADVNQDADAEEEEEDYDDSPPDVLAPSDVSPPPAEGAPEDTRPEPEGAEEEDAAEADGEDDPESRGNTKET